MANCDETVPRVGGQNARPRGKNRRRRFCWQCCGGYWDQKEARQQKVGALAANREAERAALTRVGDKGDGGAAGIADVLEPERSSAAVSGLWRQSSAGQRRGDKSRRRRSCWWCCREYLDRKEARQRQVGALAAGRRRCGWPCSYIGAGKKLCCGKWALWRQSDAGKRRGRQEQAAKVLLAVVAAGIWTRTASWRPCGRARG